MLHAVRGKSLIAAAHLQGEISHPMSGISAGTPEKALNPATFNPNLSWTHYRTLVRVEKPEARAFYEIEAMKNNWAARESERQSNSRLYERVALRKDKKGLMELWHSGTVMKKCISS